MNGLILFEDDHLLVVNKPSGINTHQPDQFAPDGIHEWLTKREPRWRTLSILQRLDKDTSGVMVFGKTREAAENGATPARLFGGAGEIGAHAQILADGHVGENLAALRHLDDPEPGDAMRGEAA